MAKSILEALVQQVNVTVTQGGADAFAVTTIETGISTAARFGWLIDSVEFHFGTAISATPQTADCDAQLILTKEQITPTSLITPSDEDYIAGYRLAMPGIAAAVNQYVINLDYKWAAPPNTVVVAPRLQFAIDSSGTTATNVGYVRVNYFPMELSEMDLLRLIALN